MNYFSNWIWSAIHFLTSIPEFQTPESLSERLGIQSKTVLRFLKQLESQGLIRNSKGRWIYQTGEFHLPKESPLVILHHQNWRLRAVLDAQEFENDGVHFTGVHTLSKSDFKVLKEMVLSFISSATSLAGTSDPQEGIVFICDLFRI